MLGPDIAAAHADRIMRGIAADASFVGSLNELGVSLMAAIRPSAMISFGAPANGLAVSCTPVDRPMGVAWDGKLLAVGGRRDITVFAPSIRLADHLPG